MNRVSKLQGVIGTVALMAGLVVLAPIPIAHGAINNDMPFQSQAELDGETIGDCSSWCAGGWAAMDNGVSDRPYIKYLATRTYVGGGDYTEEMIIYNEGNVPNPEPDPSFNVTATVGAVNLCAPSQTNNCYESPNRVAINFGWRDGDQGTTDLGASGASPSLDSDSEIVVTVGLNTLGRTLRWSYLEGTPTHWEVSDLGTDHTTIRLRFRPAFKPWTRGEGCSQIPVNPTCPTTSAEAQYKVGSLLLSLDDTLDQVFAGALFAGEGMFIGSLEAVAPSQTESGGSAPQMTYGIAAPVTINGVANRPTFHAFLSDQAILNYFGATPDVAATSGFFNTAFQVAASASGGQSISAERWTDAEGYGTDGWLITISDIQIATQTASSRLHAAARVAKNPHYSVKNKVRPAMIVANRTSAILYGNVTGCNSSANCRIVVNKINSKTGTRTSALGTAVLRSSGSQLAAQLTFARAIPLGTRVSIVVQKKKPNNTWGTYVTSVVRKVFAQPR